MMRIYTAMALLIATVLLFVSADAARTSAPLYLLAEDVAPGSEAISEETTSPQDPPVVEADPVATPTQPGPGSANPPEQDPPPAEQGQDLELEPAPQPPPQ